MNEAKLLVAVPMLLALLACKGTKAGPATGETSEEPAIPAAQDPANDSVPVSAGASATTGNVPLTVVEGRSGIEDTGFLHITGLIKNDSSRWISFARVDIQLFDADGKPIGVDSIAAAEGRGERAYAIRDNTPPGESNPFHYVRDVKKLARPYASHKLVAHAIYSDGKTHATVEGVKIDKEHVGKIEYLRVSGTIKNTGNECRYPKAVLAYFDASGKLYAALEGVDQWDVKTPFTPGATAAFSTGPLETKDIVKDVKVWGDCRQP
jgi:hypothetical protein